ncbi:expressed protein [Dictyostelium purpureum]|uniref:Expressed protein n=1 Tax=Dictyostelium purpureum TaxID=5786 RepID=F0ZGV3_DICPU|nr:uncharacterized protein DICPUDRAFT_91754 [Dictyostelium purpureum]EGC36853.1 expressed protein [Dictyostelium purpureum]|eukprot:XP_003286651.1 expressed protein [Dictyostelium purpureum]
MTISDSLKKINSFSFDQVNNNKSFNVNNGINNNFSGTTLTKDQISSIFKARCYGVAPGCGH